MTTKLILVVIGLTSVSAILVPTYAVPTIRSADIFDGEVKTADIANNAVTSPKIQDGQVNTADLANDAVTSSKIKNGEVKTEDLASGVIPPASSFKIQTEVRTEDIPTMEPHNLANFVVDCESGETVTGGGFHVNTALTVVASHPAPANDGWWVGVWNNVDFTNQEPGTIYVECAKIVPAT